MKTIAVIEDDQHIGDILERNLAREGFAVLRAYSGTEAVYMLSVHTPDLILLDLMLPGLCGEEILPEMEGIPVIVVSARAGVDDKVDLLLKGAVDYVTKPFHVKELLARIRVHLRDESRRKPALLLRTGALRMDTVSREVWAGETEVKLTRTEYAVLKLLMQNPGRAISKSVILDEICGDTPDCTDGSLKQHVSNLRRKLRDAAGGEYIESIWGIGFKLKAE